MQHQTTRPTIPFPIIDLSPDNPIPEILSAPKFGATETAIYKTPASQRALISAAAAALIYTLVRNAKPRHVVEIGTYYGGTSELICQALYENGSGTLHTVSPFEAERVIPIFDSWPPELRRHLEFYLMTSMDFYYRLNARGIRPEIAFIDGDHSYQAALFDIQSLAKSLARRGFLLVDDVSQPGPYYAAMDFLQRNPDWTQCKARSPRWADPNKAIHAESGGGTLHVQCVLRGFGPASAEQVAMAALDIATPGVVDLKFPQPLKIEGTFGHCTVEPWLVWSGQTPLLLAEIPAIIS